MFVTVGGQLTLVFDYQVKPTLLAAHSPLPQNQEAGDIKLPQRVCAQGANLTLAAPCREGAYRLRVCFGLFSFL